MPCSLSSLDHGHSYSVLDASQGVEVLNLGYDGCIQAFCNSIQSDQRRIANGLGEIFVNLSHKSTSSFHENNCYFGHISQPFSEDKGPYSGNSKSNSDSSLIHN